MQDKISAQFKARLGRLEPQQKIHAIVVLHTKDSGVVPTRRQSAAERQAAIEAVRRSAEPALIEIDSVLERFSGKRLAPAVDAFGSIPVETTAAAITALATIEHVRAILEDQPISLLHSLPDPPPIAPARSRQEAFDWIA